MTTPDADAPAPAPPRVSDAEVERLAAWHAGVAHSFGDRVRGVYPVKPHDHRRTAAALASLLSDRRALEERVAAMRREGDWLQDRVQSLEAQVATLTAERDAWREMPAYGPLVVSEYPDRLRGWADTMPDGPLAGTLRGAAGDWEMFQMGRNNMARDVDALMGVLETRTRQREAAEAQVASLTATIEAQASVIGETRERALEEAEKAVRQGCGKCQGAGWLWDYELDAPTDRDPSYGNDDTRYLCDGDVCGGANRIADLRTSTKPPNHLRSKTP